MPNKNGSTISLYSFRDDFPLKGKELMRVLENLWVFPLAINDPDAYAKWVEFNPKIAKDLDLLITWSEKVKNNVIVVEKEG